MFVRARYVKAILLCALIVVCTILYTYIANFRTFMSDDFSKLLALQGKDKTIRFHELNTGAGFQDRLVLRIRPSPNLHLSLDNASNSDVTRSVLVNPVTCPVKPASLLGPIHVDIQGLTRPDPANRLSVSHGGFVQKGGLWKPEKCKARKKVAILIPYRKRPEQLQVFLKHMHPVFQRQMLNYRVFVIEQVSASRLTKPRVYRSLRLPVSIDGSLKQ